MTLGFTNSYFHVNSASSLSRDRLDETVADAKGRAPLADVVQQAQAQGVEGVTVENVNGTLVIGKVAIRQAWQDFGGLQKARAGQVMRKRQVIENAPLRIAGQPAYTVEQIAAEVASHDAEARRSKARPQRAGRPEKG